jgi:hypothetical protein
MRLLVFSLLFISLASAAQTGPIDIYLTSGKIISTHNLYLFSSYKSYLRVDNKKGEKIYIDLVDHIEGIDQEGNYRYFKPVSWGNTVWAERGFTSNRIVIYHTDIVTGTMVATHKPKSCLYSKDGGPLRQLKLKHLKKDMADCPASLGHLKKGKGIATGQTIISVVSYSLILAGTITWFADAADDELDDPGSSSLDLPPTVLIGAIGAWVPIFMNGPKREKYLAALKAYR